MTISPSAREPDGARVGADGGPLAEVAVPTKPEGVLEARRVVKDAAVSLGIAGDRLVDLLIAVSEACTNAIEAQLSAAVDDPIEITCTWDGARLRVSVADSAEGFDAANWQPRPPMSHPDHLHVERGWGIQLMHLLVDDVEFLPSPTGTVVNLSIDAPSP